MFYLAVAEGGVRLDQLDVAAARQLFGESFDLKFHQCRANHRDGQVGEVDDFVEVAFAGVEHGVDGGLVVGEVLWWW